MLTAQGVKKEVTINLTEDEARFVLLLMRGRQDECRKVTAEYPPKTFALYQELDVRIEQVKMKVASQLK